jgi:hypothetical protein
VHSGLTLDLLQREMELCWWGWMGEAAGSQVLHLCIRRQFCLPRVTMVSTWDIT